MADTPQLSDALRQRMCDKLIELYGEKIGTATLQRLETLIRSRVNSVRESTNPNAILIAYGDHLQGRAGSPLITLLAFLTMIVDDGDSRTAGSDTTLNALISGLHLLPFYPYSSDDGFSVIDYLEVDPAIGTWEDIARFAHSHTLMFDLVLNHISSQSAWFQAFLRDETPYRDYFMTAEPSLDLSLVTRPRTHPLLTPYETSAGTRYVWTTFSADQVDLDFRNPDVLLEIIDTLLFYVEKGADFIRLDAIAYLWKVPGTTCIHLPRTHRVVQLMRDVLDVAASSVKLITETNVPHEENLSYFGDGTNEAQLVYNFALPPLVLDALYTGSAEILSAWARTLKTPSEQTTFFNFTASHDGIGVRPATGLLPPEHIDAMLQVVQDRGGHISYKTNPDGSQSAYEMNITYFDALMIPGESRLTSIDRFMVSQAIMLAFAGIPGIYFNSLIGAPNWIEGVQQTGRVRTINRQKFDFDDLTRQVADKSSRTAQVLKRYSRLLYVRKITDAFHPNAPQQVLDLHPSVFAIERGSEQRWRFKVLALHNVSDQPIPITLPDFYDHDRISDTAYAETIILAPYQVAWLQSTKSSYELGY